MECDFGNIVQRLVSPSNRKICPSSSAVRRTIDTFGMNSEADAGSDQDVVAVLWIESDFAEGKARQSFGPSSAEIFCNIQASINSVRPKRSSHIKFRF
ncbi:hypothetical protein D9M72_536930 [compost metagenome]